MWSHFHHGADIGVRGVGQTLEQAFEEAALALTAVIAEPSDQGATYTELAVHEDRPGEWRAQCVVDV